jgi:hypothetical protein
METAKYVAVQLKQKGPVKVVARVLYAGSVFIYITEYLETERTFSGDE